jgi:hypothetical protein
MKTKLKIRGETNNLATEKKNRGEENKEQPFEQQK